MRWWSNYSGRREYEWSPVLFQQLKKSNAKTKTETKAKTKNKKKTKTKTKTMVVGGRE